MKALLATVAAAAAVAVPAAQATNAPPANGHGLIIHPTTCYGGAFGNYPGQPVTMTPLAAGGTFWIEVDGVDLHFRVQSATITYDSDPQHPQTYDYGLKTGLDAMSITCYGSFPGYIVVSRDVLIR